MHIVFTYNRWLKKSPLARLVVEKEISPLHHAAPRAVAPISFARRRVGYATNFLLISKQLRKDSGHAIVEPQKRSSISERANSFGCS